MPFKVDLDLYHGPLDLLLYLVRKEEVEIADLPLAELTEQYLTYVALLEAINVDAVGDFLEVASTLLELKSRMVLPRADDEQDDTPEEPSDGVDERNLVERLLEFKKYRDAAAELEERGAQWRLRFARRASRAPAPRGEPAQQPIEGVELWDLVSAFGRVMRDKLAPGPDPHAVRYDGTPVHVFMRRVHERIVAEGELRFSELFPEQVHKSTLVGVFLAVLELVRHRHAVAVQGRRYGDIVVGPGPEPLAAELRAVSSAGEETDAA
ncbi:Segregation and condensation protein A [Pseudobythopirellula maris]|uniref:Segregation and condensation protein A n=1 Tax=Pseudobythopirellula maris TaxID=2527991 RepID=A0A5C5ZNP7_9BACT|nr:segregation/condensation protein A [Pseudobythopirellula maris]TWT88808.1 Segregation and condensation protein A [Pseudobythopirellula maris]